MILVFIINDFVCFHLTRLNTELLAHLEAEA